MSQAINTVAQLAETYSKARQSPRPEMYRAYRQLRLAFERSGKKAEALEAQHDALRAIGAEIDTPSTAAIGGSMLSKDPVVMLQDAIISCFDIAFRFHLAGDIENRGYVNWHRVIAVPLTPTCTGNGSGKAASYMTGNLDQVYLICG
jgi:hypothetical protein